MGKPQKTTSEAWDDYRNKWRLLFSAITDKPPWKDPWFWVFAISMMIIVVLIDGMVK